jgi:glycosyltransferase involved in cell wall biosynthesis
VDNNSSDKTKEIALKYTNKVFDKVAKSGPPRRNFGAKIARGEYIAAVDADMILSPDLIEACVAWMAQNDCSALYISEIVLGKSFWNRVRRFERSFYDGTVIDAARFYRKNVYDRLGGFDENLIGPEDWDFDKKIRRSGRVDLLEIGCLSANVETQSAWELADFIKARGVDPSEHRAVIYHNESQFDLWKYLRKKGSYLNTLDAYFRRWSKEDPDIKKQFGFWYRYLIVFIENGKWKKLLRHPILAIGMYFLRGMVGCVFVLNNKKLKNKNFSHA